MGVKNDSGAALRRLRERAGLSLRQVAARSGVTAGMISLSERNLTKPSLATLERILSALDTDLVTFTGGAQTREAGPVFGRARMATLHDGERTYTVVFPRRTDIGVEMFDETIRPGRQPAAFSRLSYDIYGYVLAGELVLQVKGRTPSVVGPGDGFHLPAGLPHRAHVRGRVPARLVTVYPVGAGAGSAGRKGTGREEGA